MNSLLSFDLLAQCTAMVFEKNLIENFPQLFLGFDLTVLTLPPKMFGRIADFRPKMAIFRSAGMRRGGLPIPLAFQYLILMI